MAKIISNNYTPIPLVRLWKRFKKLDPFTRMVIVTMTCLIIATPVVITTRFYLHQYAAEMSYISQVGEGKDSIFTISDLEVQNVTPYSATVSWTTSTPAIGTIKFWENSFLSDIIALFHTNSIADSDYTTEHTIQFPTTLKPNTTYVYKISTVTKLGDKFESSTYTFKTAKE